MAHDYAVYFEKKIFYMYKKKKWCKKLANLDGKPHRVIENRSDAWVYWLDSVLCECLCIMV